MQKWCNENIANGIKRMVVPTVWGNHPPSSTLVCLHVDSRSGLYAFPVVVLDFLHLRNQVGCRNYFRMGIASCDDQLQFGGFGMDEIQQRLYGQEPTGHGNVSLVQDH